MDTDLNWLGAHPRDVARSLLDFTRSSDLLSNDQELVGKYEQKWVGVYHGEVKAAEDDLDTLLKVLDNQMCRDPIRLFVSSKKSNGH